MIKSPKTPQHVRVVFDVFMLSDADPKKVLEEMVYNLDHEAILQADLADNRLSGFEKGMNDEKEGVC